MTTRSDSVSLPGVLRHNLPILTIAALAFCLFAMSALKASASLAIGTITTGDPVTCPSAAGWYYYTDSSQQKHYMNCIPATINCSNVSSNVQNIGLTFASLSPVGLVSGVTNARGVIVLHSGGGGTTPSNANEGDFEFADCYFGQGYEIVELAWDSDWEAIQDPFLTGVYGNIQYAACRPATFLNYVKTYIFNTVQQNNSGAGMCAQGGSAGAGALAFVLAYYGGGSYLDNVELTSGPTISDLKQGCAEGPQAAQPVTVCGQTNYNGGQYGCQLGTGGSTWTLSPLYLSGANGAVGGWTNDTSCATGLSTSTQSNLRWLQQSLVDDGTNSPTFTYSSTGMGAWLCRTVYNPNNYNCAAVNNNNVMHCPNNSSPQGQIFYANIGSSNSPPAYNLWAVNLCRGSEGGTWERTQGRVGSTKLRWTWLARISPAVSVSTATINGPLLKSTILARFGRLGSARP